MSEGSIRSDGHTRGSKPHRYRGHHGVGPRIDYRNGAGTNIRDIGEAPGSDRHPFGVTPNRHRGHHGVAGRVSDRDALGATIRHKGEGPVRSEGYAQGSPLHRYRGHHGVAGRLDHRDVIGTRIRDISDFRGGRAHCAHGRQRIPARHPNRNALSDTSVNAPDAHALLGKIYAAEGKDLEAIAELKKALVADRDGSYHYQLYRIYKKIGDEKSAAVALKEFRAIRTTPH